MLIRIFLNISLACYYAVVHTTPIKEINQGLEYEYGKLKQLD
jgi:hypothetical protein